MQANEASPNTLAHGAEVAAGERFEFGANWARFLKDLDENRIREAEKSLQKMLELDSLAGMSFLDVGCGSGLFSLAARRLGARVQSFDYDPKSVACTRELQHRYFHNDPDWNVREGSVLDAESLAQFGTFDIVYSWGVLHHTGQMWQALENVIPLVKDHGLLFIAIYNDQGKMSRRWTKIKRLYNRFPPSLRFLILWPTALQQWWRRHLKDLLLARPFHTWHEYKKQRGMSPWRDMIDWVGGYPFEVASPKAIFDFYHKRGFQLEHLETTDTLGCNEFVFRRVNKSEQLQ